MKRKPRSTRYPHLLGSRWTSVEPQWGWRHFQVRQRQDQKRGLVFAELEAVCDPQVRFWLNADLLQERTLWQPGWQPLQEDASSLKS
ncbi:MAG: TIGR02450 family Trp-rich protein [Synechococcaceae cyanobacterium SM2_3_1]|nr:TIGR02450 family Trp-rich protein [Synechococcaceae cyanobacterium SM2_3_1]